MISVLLTGQWFGGTEATHRDQPRLLAGFDAIDTGRDVRKLTGSGIRHRDAAFDPERAAERNIFYGLGAASALPWMLPVDDKE